MFHLLEHLSKFSKATATGSHCDDFVDRLNRKYTIYLLLLCCAIISSKQYVGEPLSCFCPSHFTGAHVEYTNNICWISNAYYVPIDDLFSVNSDKNSYINYLDDEEKNSPIRVAKVNNLIIFYPFLLLLQAMFFYIPYFLWKNIVNHSAYDINTLIMYAKTTQNNQESKEYRGRSLKYLIKHIDRASSYYNSKKFLHYNSGYSSEIDDNSTLLTDTSKQQIDDEDYDDHNDKQQKTTIKRKNSEKNRFNFTKNQFFDQTKKSNSLKNSKRIDSKFLKFKHFFQKYIFDALCEKFLFTIYLIIKLFYFTNSLGQLLILNKLITGDTSSMHKLFTTLSSPFVTVPAAGKSDNNDKFLQSIFTITNKNDMFLIHKNSDNNNYFSMASNNVWTGFEFGYKAIVNLFQTGSLFNSHTRLLIFHSVIFCDFKIRVLGDRLHKHTVQCVAPINIFSEKLFTLIWFWFFILTIINAYTLIEWFNFFLFSRIRYNFIFKYFNSVFNEKKNNFNRKNLGVQNDDIDSFKFSNIKPTVENNKKNLNETILFFPGENNNNSAPKTKYNEPNSVKKPTIDKNLAKKIIKSYLELDNIFIIRLISKNTNEIITHELVSLLLEYYQSKNQQKLSTGNSVGSFSNKNANVVKKSINL
jgi:hypothetical protein